MKKLLLGLAFAMTANLSAMPAVAAEKVNIGVPSWTGAQAIAHLLAAVVEDRIGGEAGLVTKPGKLYQKVCRRQWHGHAE